MPSDLHQQIAKRAYEIYQQRIGQSALDDWLQAEAEVDRSLGGQRATH